MLTKVRIVLKGSANRECGVNELNKQMEDAAMIEVTTQGNKERIREEIIELSQRIVIDIKKAKRGLPNNLGQASFYSMTGYSGSDSSCKESSSSSSPMSPE